MFDVSALVLVLALDSGLKSRETHKSRHERKRKCMVCWVSFLLFIVQRATVSFHYTFVF